MTDLYNDNHLCSFGGRVLNEETDMITIDGSFGEGGGQILRTALGLSLVTGKPFSIHHIRAGRKKPGLMRQHLTALSAATEIGQARVSGNSLGSTAFTFEPGPILPGSYRFSIGSAGSCTLVLQTILPALILADGPSDIILEGGTHNPFAPPFDFLAHSFLPLIRRMGPAMEAVLEKPGFYPAGGGRFHTKVTPASHLNRLDLIERGPEIRRTAMAAVANLPMSIARRELAVVKEKLSLADVDLRVEEVRNAAGPGNVLAITIENEHVTNVFTGFGEKGVSSERVAKSCSLGTMEFLASSAAVERHLADQLLIPMALSGGGSFSTLSPSGHTTTNIEIIKLFLDVDITVVASNTEPDVYTISIQSK